MYYHACLNQSVVHSVHPHCLTTDIVESLKKPDKPRQMLFTVECSGHILQSAVSTITGVSYEVNPLISPLIMYGCYHFGLKITFACWHGYAYFPLLDFVGSGVEAGIRLRITEITSMTGGWYMLQGCYGCGVTVDTL